MCVCVRSPLTHCFDRSINQSINHSISVACIIPVYLVIGGLIKWKVYEAEPLSVDIIPNLAFWSALPFLVKDGCVYFLQKVSGGRVCAE